MGKRKLTRIVVVILTIVFLFVLGRFYIEIDEFFNTPYSIIGLLLSIIGIMCYYIQFQKIKLERAMNAVQKSYDDCEGYRKDIYILTLKLNKKKISK